MKRLGIMAVTGVMAFALGACGGSDAPPMPDANTDDMMQAQMQQPAQDVTPAAPGASEAVTAAPSEEQMQAATVQE